MRYLLIPYSLDDMWGYVARAEFDLSSLIAQHGPDTVAGEVLMDAHYLLEDCKLTLGQLQAKLDNPQAGAAEIEGCTPVVMFGDDSWVVGIIPLD